MSGAMEFVLLVLGIGAGVQGRRLDKTLGMSNDESWGWWALAGWLIGAYWAFFNIWPVAGFMWALAALTTWLWWHRRRKRKRALQALGNKAKAIRAKLVRKAREAARPRRVLRPLPQPAGSPA